MSNARLQLIKFWKSHSSTNGMTFHKKDYSSIRKKKIELNSKKLIKKCISKKWIHYELFPNPYLGDLKPTYKKVYIISLNPGVCLLDHYSERGKSKNSIEFRKSIVNSVSQRSIDKKYPNPLLNPMFLWHSGSIYWREKLNDIIGLLAIKHHNKNMDFILSILSNRITFLELFPYHSRSGETVKTQLQSTLMLIEFVKYLIQFTTPTNKKVLIIILRRGEFWKDHLGLTGISNKRGSVKGHPNLILYQGAQSQRASLNLNSTGGKAIKQFWNI